MSIEVVKTLASDGVVTRELDPVWDVVEHAIRKLDGVHQIAVVLDHRDSSAELWIHGGRQGNFYVHVDAEGEVAHLMNPSGEDDEFVMNCEGQDTEFFYWQLVKLPVALQAARTFYGSGAMDCSLEWHRGLPMDWTR